VKIVKLIQGTAAWHQYRAEHFNASDAPAMLGVSPYKSRSNLIRERATGITPEIDAATQRRFDDGHCFEAHALPLAEKIIGEDLYPCVGEDGVYSASFDGLTLDGGTVWEHKTINAALREAFADIDTINPEHRDTAAFRSLPEHYRVQLEQQCMVSGAARALFSASAWNDQGELIDEAHCWYTPDPKLRARIVAGWAQFAADVAAYQPEPAPAAAPVGKAPETLPSLRVEAQGMVTFSNLADFREQAMAVLGGINRELVLDEDFANAEQTVKWCKGVEDRLDATKAAVLAQMQSVDEVCRTIDDVAAETRRVRLELDKLVKTEKERRRADIVAHYRAHVSEHYAAINATLGEHAMPVPAAALAAIGEAIKGRKTLGSITDAADEAAASLKIDASQQAERVRQNIAVLAEHAEHAHLFADRVALCASKAPDDLRNLAAARIAEYQQREAARVEAERERIRAEEAAKLQREQRQREIEATEATEKAAAPAAVVAEPVQQSAAQQTPAAAVRPGSRIKLGDINARIAPLSITADGLASLGFRHVGMERAAKLYNEDDFTAMCRAMYAVIRDAATPAEQRKAS
jgi:putative phage-type endonuclease